MWKFQDFSTTQILREINFGDFEALKTVNLTICAVVKASKMVKTAVFDVLKSAKIDFT